MEEDFLSLPPSARYPFLPSTLTSYPPSSTASHFSFSYPLTLTSVMSGPEFHEATLKWPHPEANDVVVTGEFDGWSQTIHLTRTKSGFEAAVKIPWGRKIAYKYIVDGRWTTTDTQPTELDPIGNINNVYTAPARPEQPKGTTPVETPPTKQPTATEPSKKKADQQEGPQPSEPKVVPGVAPEAVLPPPVPVQPLITNLPPAATAEIAPPIEGISTHGPGVNGASHPPTADVAAAVPLPPPTPAEAPLSTTPATNGKTGKTAETSSTTSTPSKDKRMPFPSLGRHHRKSTSSADVSEHGESTGSPKSTVSTRLGVKKKRTSSFFGGGEEVMCLVTCYDCRMSFHD
ncbi:unnamed protein product [Somion occarium]|uniref:AMP-activated protein kinase glycogen-binding domain-containing protein n=1 Tax=Somion occarium TaxID=3059160 RepID=A0ABP1D2I0_9APHY